MINNISNSTNSKQSKRNTMNIIPESNLTRQTKGLTELANLRRQLFAATDVQEIAEIIQKIAQTRRAYPEVQICADSHRFHSELAAQLIADFSALAEQRENTGEVDRVANSSPKTAIPLHLDFKRLIYRSMKIFLAPESDEDFFAEEQRGFTLLDEISRKSNARFSAKSERMDATGSTASQLNALDIEDILKILPEAATAEDVRSLLTTGSETTYRENYTNICRLIQNKREVSDPLKTAAILHLLLQEHLLAQTYHRAQKNQTLSSCEQLRKELWMKLKEPETFCQMFALEGRSLTTEMRSVRSYGKSI